MCLHRVGKRECQKVEENSVILIDQRATIVRSVGRDGNDWSTSTNVPSLQLFLSIFVILGSVNTNNGILMLQHLLCVHETTDAWHPGPKPPEDKSRNKITTVCAAKTLLPWGCLRPPILPVRFMGRPCKQLRPLPSTTGLRSARKM